ncbi:hypothetical protein GCE86_24775 [Micromonospora terminaliae]|uniref:EcsC family protein n=1 Tax=Micromonospora terminaliae TaxID=1914461 RepID=A0AAJ2ZIJ3_9ACTN|nr:hypothetical protein [Micromonospora terminaliae]NES29874.1 hypothetical protein [Micromonospora terminaliae]QGL49949.1 hypothetical protein GCE86_24775 [Micromonospora terminaliae]
MHEQPPSDPPRREPAPQARRRRSPRPTFTPPPTPDPAPAEAADDTPPRPRIAPTVLFQPPDPAQAAPPAAAAPAAPHQRPPAEAAAGPGTPAGVVAPTDPGTPAVAPPPATVPADEAVIEEAPKRTRRATAPKKATPAKKPTPAARKPASTAEAPVAAPDSVPASEAPAPRATAPGADAVGPAGAATETVTPARSDRARKSTKATPAKKAAPAKRTPARRASATPAPVQPDVAAPPFPAREVVPVAAVPVGRQVEGQGWRELTARVLDHPGFAPELLALAAVDALGPRAAAWVGRTRDAYPDADADGLARLVTRRFVRLAGTGGALAAGAGLFAPVAELTAVLWTQANLVLHLAAVYGRDPAHPDRVAELLVLTQVHPDAGTARAALDGLRSAGAPVEGSLSRVAEAAWRLATPLAAQAAGWLALRLAARLLPGAAALAAATGDATAAERLAARATTLYRPARR